jgi:hypothetical protein
MISLRLAIPAVLAAAAVAGCFIHFTAPSARVEADPPTTPTMPSLTGTDIRASANVDRAPTAEEKAAEAYREAAEAILRRAPNAQASAGADEPPIMRPIPIPLPRRRPVARP